MKKILLILALFLLVASCDPVPKVHYEYPWWFGCLTIFAGR